MQHQLNVEENRTLAKWAYCCLLLAKEARADADRAIAHLKPTHLEIASQWAMLSNEIRSQSGAQNLG